MLRGIARFKADQKELVNHGGRGIVQSRDRAEALLLCRCATPASIPKVSASLVSERDKWVRLSLYADATDEVTYHCSDRHCQSASHADSYGCAHYRRASRTGPCHAKRNKGEKSAHNHRDGSG